jgi:hypothetical protein
MDRSRNSSDVKADLFRDFHRSKRTLDKDKHDSMAVLASENEAYSVFHGFRNERLARHQMALDAGYNPLSDY